MQFFKTYVASSLEDGMLALLMIVILGLTIIGTRNCTREWIDRTYGTHVAAHRSTQ